MKVALVVCPIWDARHPVYALASLSAQLARRGHEVRILDINKRINDLGPPVRQSGSSMAPDSYFAGEDREYVEAVFLPAHRRYLESEIENALRDGFRTVAFYIGYTTELMSIIVAEMFKRRDPGATVVFGGPSCLEFANCRSLLERECVDAVIYGEADISFPRLIDRLESEGGLRADAGVLLRRDPSTWIESQNVLEDLDALPFADFSGYDLKSYGVKMIHTTRGCVRKCVFCAQWREMSYRHMSAPRVFDELRHQLHIHPEIKSFFFADSLVNGSIRRLESLCDLIIDGGLEPSWHGFAIVRSEMSRELLAKMRRAGCWGLRYGVESGSDKISRELGKSVPAALNARVLEDTVRAGILTSALWMIGFPTETETESDFEDSLEFIREHSSGISRLIVNLFTVRDLGPGYWEKYGVKTPAHSVYWTTRDGKNAFPRRVDRLVRLMEVAQSRGIQLVVQGNPAIDSAEAVKRLKGEMLDRYARAAR